MFVLIAAILVTVVSADAACTPVQHPQALSACAVWILSLLMMGMVGILIGMAVDLYRSAR